MYNDEMRMKELNNGRMAMISVLGIFAAEMATARMLCSSSVCQPWVVASLHLSPPVPASLERHRQNECCAVSDQES